MTSNSHTPLSSRAKIAGALGIGFGFFAGVGVTGLSLMMGVLGIWAWIIGLRGPKRPLWGAIKNSFKRTYLVWICFVGFVVWVMITALWSPASELAGESVRRIGAMLLLAPVAVWAASSMGTQNAKTSQAALLAGLAMAYFILLFEVLTGAAMNRLASPEKEPLAIAGDLGRAATAILALFWTGFACLHKTIQQRGVLIWYGVTSFVIALQFGTDLNAVGIVFGSVMAVLALFYPRFAIGLVSAGSALTIMVAPFLYVLVAKFSTSLMPSGVLPLSYARRAQMWQVSSDLIAQKPLEGWGLGAGSTFDRIITYGGIEWPLIQLHPHAAPLHIWLETGAIGATLISLTIVLAGAGAISAFKRHKVAASVLVGGITFLALQWGLSHSAWREWMWVTFAFVIASSLSLRVPQKRVPFVERRKAFVDRRKAGRDRRA